MFPERLVFTEMFARTGETGRAEGGVQILMLPPLLPHRRF